MKNLRKKNFPYFLPTTVHPTTKYAIAKKLFKDSKKNMIHNTCNMYMCNFKLFSNYLFQYLIHIFTEINCAFA